MLIYIARDVVLYFIFMLFTFILKHLHIFSVLIIYLFVEINKLVLFITIFTVLSAIYCGWRIVCGAWSFDTQKQENNSIIHVALLLSEWSNQNQDLFFGLLLNTFLKINILSVYIYGSFISDMNSTKRKPGRPKGSKTSKHKVSTCTKLHTNMSSKVIWKVIY
jgi:hypothetical protein